MIFAFLQKMGRLEAENEMLRASRDETRQRYEVDLARLATERDEALKYARTLMDRLMEKSGVRAIVDPAPEPARPVDPWDAPDALESLEKYQERMMREEAKAIARYEKEIYAAGLTQDSASAPDEGDE